MAELVAESAVEVKDASPVVASLAEELEASTLAPKKVTHITEHLLSYWSFRDPRLGIRKSIQDALCLDMGKENASLIQEYAIPLINEGRNIKAQAQSGAGKTICFCLGILNRIDENLTEVQAICTAPYRELVEQIHGEFLKLVKRTPEIQIEKLVAGGYDPQTKATPLCKSHVVVGTPAMVQKYSSPRPRDQLPAFFKLDRIKVFVVDEADDQVAARETHRAGQAREEANKLMTIIQKLPPSCQVLLFSATYPPESEELCTTALFRHGKEPANIALKKEELNLKEIFQISMDVSTIKPSQELAEFNLGANELEKRKLFVLREILEKISMEKCIIFSTKRTDAFNIQNMCGQMNPPIRVEVLVGGKFGIDEGAMSPEDRTRVSEKFRTDGTCRFLVSTNLIARGYDVPEVSTVVNYELPTEWSNIKGGPPKGDSETYIHRVGRTGRFGRKGVAINLLNGEADKKLMDSIARSAYVSDGASGVGGTIVRDWDPNNITDLVSEVNAFTGRG